MDHLHPSSPLNSTQLTHCQDVPHEVTDKRMRAAIFVPAVRFSHTAVVRVEGARDVSDSLVTICLHRARSIYSVCSKSPFQHTYTPLLRGLGVDIVPRYLA